MKMTLLSMTEESPPRRCTQYLQPTTSLCLCWRGAASAGAGRRPSTASKARPSGVVSPPSLSQRPRTRWTRRLSTYYVQHRGRTPALAIGTAGGAGVARQSLRDFDRAADAGTVPRSARVAVQAVWRGRKICEEKAVERGKDSTAILRDLFKATSRPLCTSQRAPSLMRRPTVTTINR
jgi:hypothetical protein